jgi:putative DNA primase/helicase
METVRALGGRVLEVAHEIASHHFFAKDVAGTLYHYRGGVYRPDGKDQIAKATKELLRKSGFWDSKLPEQVTQYISIDANPLWATPKPHLVNVRNGLLDVNTGKRYLHSPNHLSSIQLPVIYDPNADCDAWDWFLEGSLPQDAAESVFEIIAYAMQTDRSLQKAGLFIGPGEDGKSILLNSISAFIGPSNISNLSLHRLEGDRFACARLVGKLLNVWADLPSHVLPDSSMFKCIVGQDRIIGENKFERTFEFIPYVFLLFSANNHPRVRDAGHAIFRRWHVTQFERTFTDEEKVPSTELLKLLTEPSQLSGVLNRALAVFPTIRENGFSIPESSRNAMDEFISLTDPMAAWLNQHTKLSPSTYLPMALLLGRYNAQQREEQRPEKTQNAFTRDLKRLRPQVETKQRTINGKTVWCYVGIS